MDDYILQMQHITKTFPGVKALDDVCFNVRRGEIHALVGENGAGKSTLMKVLSGIYGYGSYEGDIVFNGEVQRFGSIRDSENKGIAIIYQELALCTNLSVAESIFLGSEVKGKGGLINWQETYKKTAECLKRVHLDLNPETLVVNLGVGQMQLLEICKAISKNAKLLILDEPTAALTDNESDHLLSLLREFREQGVTCIYISHKLDEVFAIADRVQVLRNGESVYEGLAADTDKDTIINSMCGRELKDMYPVGKRELGDVVFEIKNLGDGFLNDISINVRRHEIVGLYGLMGSGCSEVLQCAFGARRHQKGSFFVNGKEIKINKPIDAKNAGLAYVPAERKREGLILAHSVLNNLTIVTLKDFVKGLFLDLKEERRTAQKWCENYRIKTPSLNTPASSLSGGNQQKIVISKWVATKPKVFMLNDPTKGIDVGAKVEIYKDIERLCKAGCGVLYVAAELPELLGIADRVYVIHEGKLAGEFSGEEITQKNIVKSAIGE